MRDVIVVGAGIAGLAAAWDLRNRDLLVLEAGDRIGGVVRSEPRDRYWLNLGAHVFSSPDSASGRLIADVGVQAIGVPGALVAVAMNGKIVAGGRPESFLFRLPLGARDRAALVRAGAKLRLAVRAYTRISAPRAGETVAETRSRILSWRDDETFADFLGALPADADAMFRPTVTRSSAEPEEISAGQGIGFFALGWNRKGGFARSILGGSTRLIDGIGAELGERIMLRAQVTEVAADGDGVTVRYSRDGGEHEERAAHVVVAAKAFETAEIVHDLPPATRQALRDVRYGPMVVLAVLTNEQHPMPYDDIYALATPKRPFNMIFNLGNVARSPHARVREPGGSLMIYRGGSGGRHLLELSEAEVTRQFLDGLHDVYPRTRGIVCETILHRRARMLPYAFPGRGRLQQALTAPLGRVRLAGDYLGGWYTETAIATGQEAARAIRADLQSGALR